MDASVYTVANKDTLGKLIPNKDKNWAQEIVGSITSMLESIPVVNVLTYVAFWVSVFPTFIAYLLWRKRKEYEILLNELATFNPEMLDKQRVLAITKSDM